MTTALSIIALLLSVISIVFTGYQWWRSGPVLTIDVTSIEADDMHSMIVVAEITSNGRIPTTVRDLRIKYEMPERFYEQHLSLSEEGRLELSENLPAKLAPTDVLVMRVKHTGTIAHWRGYKFSVEAKAGQRWFSSRTLPLANPLNPH
jgi:hypothetical protein